MRRLGFTEKNKFLFLKHILSVIFGKQKTIVFKVKTRYNSYKKKNIFRKAMREYSNNEKSGKIFRKHIFE